MPAKLLSYLGSWWSRWFGQPGSSSPVAAPAAVLEPVVAVGLRPEQRKQVTSVEEPLESAEQSFRETVRLSEGVTAAAMLRSNDGFVPAVADADVRERTLEMLAGLKQIPALQSLVQGFVRAMGRSEVTIEEIVRAIQNDAALCVRVLGMANSVFVSSAQRIEDLHTAVHMLGVVRVRRVAQAVFTLRDAQRMTEGLDWRHLWIHAFATAAIAEELEARLRPATESQVHLAALLHDVGKIVLSTVAPEAYRDVLVAAWNGEGRLDELERQRLGVEHREAGNIFARNHQLPDSVISAILHHASPHEAEEFRFEVSLVSLANYLSKAHGLGFSGARLDDRDGEFEDLPAWTVVAQELGYAPDAAELSADLGDFIARLRVELKGLRETA